MQCGNMVSPEVNCTGLGLDVKQSSGGNTPVGTVPAGIVHIINTPQQSCVNVYYLVVIYEMLFIIINLYLLF